MTTPRHLGKLSWLILTAGTVAVVAVGAFWIVEARRAVAEAIEDMDSGFEFTVRPIPQAALADIEYLSAPPGFVDGRVFEGALYLAGSGGIWVYDLGGEFRSAYLAGRDLPPSPPVALETGRVSGEAASRLWIGTRDGLLAFDGTRFSEIRLEDPSLGNVTALLMLPTGNLLIGLSEGGVVAWDGSAFRPFHPDLRDIPVTAMDGDDGDLWVGTRDRGVLHVSGGAVQEFGADEGLPAPHVLSIAAREDRAFVGTAFGVAEFRNGRFIRPLAEGVLALSMLAPTRGNLLIGTIDEGVVEVALESPRGPGFGPLASPGPTEPRRLLEIDGTAYALTSEAFFERDDATGLWREQIAARPVWADRNVSAMAFDRFGRLWIGYFDRGLDIGNAVGDAVEGVGGGGIRTALHIEDDQVFCVNRIVADPYRDVQVVATANGLILIGLDGTVLRRLGRDDGLISEHVTDIAIHADGLVAATAAGVTRMDPAGPESIYAFHGLVNNHVYALAMDEGGLMAGTLGGLSWIEDGFVRASYTTSNSPLSHNWISAIVGLDVSGTSSPSGSRFFVGTYGGGVMRLDGNGVWTGFPDIPEGTVVNPNAMLAVDGRVFAGTLESGLLVYDPDSERWRAETSGLPSLNVTALAASADRLFVGTDNGAISMPLPDVNR